MPVDDDVEDLAALEASPPPSPQRQEGEPEGPAAVAAAAARSAAARSRIQQRGNWYAAHQSARAVPGLAVTPSFVSGGALHSTSTKNKEVILPPTLTRASDGDAGQGESQTPSEKQERQEGGLGGAGDDALFLPDARICSRSVTEFSHLAVQKEGKTMAVLCLPWLYQKLHKDVLLLGRGDHADIHTDHPSCSRAHCEIRRVLLPDGRCSYTLEDLNSAHGTLVNGGKIAPRKPTVLDDDDELQVGFSQRLYTFKKGDDKLGMQRREPSPPAAAAISPPPPPDSGSDANSKPSFLQKHIERRARMGSPSWGRGGGGFSGDRQRFQQEWGRQRGDSGDPGGRREEDGVGRGFESTAGSPPPAGTGGWEGSPGAPHWRASGSQGHGGLPDHRYHSNGDREGGPVRRERGGWQRSPYSSTSGMGHGNEGYGFEGGAPSAFKGANATPLGGGRWGGRAPYASDMPAEATGYPPVPPPAGGPYPPVPPPTGGPYQTATSPAGGLYEPSMQNAGDQYGPLMQHLPPVEAEPNPPSLPAKPSFAVADRVYVHHIILKFAGAFNISGKPEVATLRDGKTPMQRTREQAKQYLEQARHLLQEQPQHFGDYAEELSDCPSYKRRGEVGWLLSNGMLESGEQLFPPLMAAGALALQIGQLSPVLESHMGFHLFLRTG